MKYEEVKTLIRCQHRLRSGLTWQELKDQLNLPYKTLCPEWIIQLEKDINLVRQRTGKSRAFIWSLRGAQKISGVVNAKK